MFALYIPSYHLNSSTQLYIHRLQHTNLIPDNDQRSKLSQQIFFFSYAKPCGKQVKVIICRSQIRNQKTILPASQTIGNTEKLFLYNLSRRFRVQILFKKHTSPNQTAQHIYNRRPSLQSYQLHPVRYEHVPQTYKHPNPF